MAEQYPTDHPIDRFFRERLKGLNILPSEAVRRSVMSRLQNYFTLKSHHRPSSTIKSFIAGLITGALIGVLLLYPKRLPESLSPSLPSMLTTATTPPPDNHPSPAQNHPSTPPTTLSPLTPSPQMSTVPQQGTPPVPSSSSSHPSFDKTPTASQTTASFSPHLLSASPIPVGPVPIPITIHSELGVNFRTLMPALRIHQEKHPSASIVAFAGATLLNTWLTSPNPYERYSYKPYTFTPTLSIAPFVELSIYTARHLTLNAGFSIIRAGQTQKINWGGRTIDRQIKINYLTGSFTAGKQFHKLGRYGTRTVDLFAGVFVARMYRAGDYENQSLREDIYNRLKVYDWGIHLGTRYSIPLWGRWSLNMETESMIGLRDLNAPRWQTGKGWGMHNIWIGAGISIGYRAGTVPQFKPIHQQK